MARSFVAASSHYLERVAAPVGSAPPFSVAGWFNEASSGFHGLASLENSSALTHQLLYINSSGALIIESANGTITPLATTIATRTLNVWQHAAAVVASTGSRAVYLNGGGKVTETTVAALTGIDRVSLGRNYNAGTPNLYLDGLLAEWGLWSIALTDADVLALSLGVSPLFVRPDALVAYWPLIGATSPEIDPRGRYELTVSGAAAAAHPRVYLPRQRATFSRVIPTPASTGQMLTVF